MPFRRRARRPLRSRRRVPPIIFGRPLAPLRRRTARRDPARRARSSDVVWGLVERMMGGGEAGTAASVELAEVIGSGLRAGGTIFLRVESRSYKRGGRVYPGQVREHEYAAVTPGRSITLFGVRKRWEKGGTVMVGYKRRFAMGDSAEYGSYNLSYYGPILHIGPKTVTIATGWTHGTHGGLSSRPEGRPEVKKLTIERFSSRNWDFDVHKKAEENSETMRYI